jgi:OOP family OmpA-OmpF porin
VKPFIFSAVLSLASAAQAQVAPAAPGPAPVAGAPASLPGPPAAAPGASAPIVVAGTVADEAGKAALLARLRAVYGHERVLDQLAVGNVSTPANWNEYVARLIGPNLKLISRGQLKVDGNTVSLRGDVPNEGQRQQIAAEIAASLNPTYTVNNGLRVAASGQGVLDAALANRIIEFESGKAALTPSGMAILDQMSEAMKKLGSVKVEVIGHTDNAGSRAGNLSLSQARADAVKAYVAARGIRPDLIAVSGEGPDRPVADNRTNEGRARNRRIEFKVVQ